MNTIATCRGAFNQLLIFCNVCNVRKFSKAFCLHNSPLKTPNDSYLVQIYSPSVNKTVNLKGQFF